MVTSMAVESRIRTARGIRTCGERVLLIIALSLVALTVGGTSLFSDGLALLPTAGWLLAGPIFALLHAGQVLRSGAAVGPECCPEWQASIAAAQVWLGLAPRDRSRVVVTQDPHLNAAALWWPGPPLLLLTSGLAAQFAGPDDDALRRAIWAHERAHALWHQPWRLWLALPSRVPTLLRVPWLPLMVSYHLLTLAWARRAEQSADRLALVAACSLTATLTVLATVATGVRPASTGALRAQIQTQRQMATFGLDRIAQLGSTHPFLWRRIRYLLEYALSPAFAAVVGPDFAAAMHQEAADLGLEPTAASPLAA
jgi:Zn-dependent protease with chaperone function